MMLKTYFSNVGIVLSQALNAIVFAGDPDETLSSRCGRTKDKNKACKLLCKALHLLDKNHCKDAIGQ